MMTQTHVLIGLALFGRPKDPGRNLMAIAGGIVPDAAIFVMYAIEKFRGTPERLIWNEIYNSPFWQDAVAWGNSIPLWLAILFLGYLLSLKPPMKTASIWCMVFAGSCLAHMACDFPLHVEDAHRHFFPLTSWRFRSSVSYWDPRHFGIQASVIEVLMGIAISVLLIRRFNTLWSRIGIGVLLVGYLAVPTWFAIQFFVANQ